MQLTVYTDTSVIGGCFDDEFSEASTRLIEEFRSGNKILVASDLMLRELEEAPTRVQQVFFSIPNEHIDFVILDEEANLLASKYIEEGAVSNNFLIDAQHIAIATISRVDVLVSWNFKHIVNLRRIQLYNATNLKYGYPTLEIRSPLEILE